MLLHRPRRLDRLSGGAQPRRGACPVPVGSRGGGAARARGQVSPPLPPAAQFPRQWLQPSRCCFCSSVLPRCAAVFAGVISTALWRAPFFYGMWRGAGEPASSVEKGLRVQLSEAFDAQIREVPLLLAAACCRGKRMRCFELCLLHRAARLCEPCGDGRVSTQAGAAHSQHMLLDQEGIVTAIGADRSACMVKFGDKVHKLLIGRGGAFQLAVSTHGVFHASASWRCLCARCVGAPRISCPGYPLTRLRTDWHSSRRGRPWTGKARRCRARSKQNQERAERRPYRPGTDIERGRGARD